MSAVKATIFHGDVTLETPDTPSGIDNFGWGDLNIGRNVQILGTGDSLNLSTGSLVVSGGIGVIKNVKIGTTLDVIGTTRLNELFVDTSLGATNVTGPNGVLISVGAASQFISTGGTLTLSSQNEMTTLSGGLNTRGSVQIFSTAPDGGIRLSSGTSGSGRTELYSGLGGMFLDSRSNFSILGRYASSDIKLLTNSDSQDLLIELDGATNSSLILQAKGTSSTNALLYRNTNPIGGMTFTNVTNGIGSINLHSGSGGVNITTNTSGIVSITAGSLGCHISTFTGGSLTTTVHSASTIISNKTSDSNQNIEIALENKTNSSILIKSEGIGTRSIVLETQSSTGDILITNATSGFTTSKITMSSGAGGIDMINHTSGGTRMTVGSGGLNVITYTTGQINLTSYGATSSFINKTITHGQDLTIGVENATDSKLILKGEGTDPLQAITLRSTSGGTTLEAAGIISLQTINTAVTGGVRIATETGLVPVHIGHPSSLTTINGNTVITGDLTVSGTTTTINTETMTVEDNIVVVNSAPSSVSDGGLAVKRYQTVIDYYPLEGMGGEVVTAPTPKETGTALSGSATTIELKIGSSAVNNYYTGWWIRIIDGLGAGQIRKIKSYDGTTRIATIYSTADEISAPQLPPTGRDFVQAPDPTSVYNLYSCSYALAIWKENPKEWSFICSADETGPNIGVSGYSNVHMGNLVVENNIQTSTLNGMKADIFTTLTLNDYDSTPAEIDVPLNYGIYTVMIRPATKTTRPYGIFMIGRTDNPIYDGTAVRIVSVRGTDNRNSQLDVSWGANGKPVVYYRPHPNEAGMTTVYNVKITTL
jgi:hypothetical protein